MNIREANATAKLIETYLDTISPDPDKLREDVKFLAGRVNKALMAGPTPERVDAAWPNRLDAPGSRPCRHSAPRRRCTGYLPPHPSPGTDR